MDLNNIRLHKKLDAEFRRILRIIKPYIPCIMNNEYLTSYRLWLERLSVVDPSEKEERNKYIMELCYQIQDGILEYPFTQFPTNGPLPKFKAEYSNSPQVDANSESVPYSRRNSYQKTPSSSNRHQEPYQQNCYKNTSDVEKSNSPKPSYESNSSKLRNQIVSHDNNTSKQRTHHTISKTPNPQLPQGLHNLMESYIASTNIQSPSSCKPVYPDVASIGNYLYTPSPPLSKITHGVSSKQQRVNGNQFEEDASWCDITDVTTSTGTKRTSTDSAQSPNTKSPINDASHASQEIYETKIAELMKIINDLQVQNIRLNENVINYERDITIRNTNAETSIHNLVGEVNSLKSRLQELREIKTALRNSQNAGITQWESTINSLNTELEAAQHQNDLLRGQINTLEEKLNEVADIRQKDSNIIKHNLSLLHEHEIESLKQNQMTQIGELELKFNQKLDELKLEYENKISEFKVNYEKVVEAKDSEIKRLENLIDIQCKRMHEEVDKIRSQVEETQVENVDTNMDKIVFLQKCISKMDKLFKKSERNFHKQIAKLKAEIEMRDKLIHIQLSTQRAELVANTNTEKQLEIDATVVHLEDRYKKLLESQQSYFLSEKKQDTTLISELRAALTKNNIDNGL